MLDERFHQEVYGQKDALETNSWNVEMLEIRLEVNLVGLQEVKKYVVMYY